MWAATVRMIHKPAVCACWNTQLTARGGPGYEHTSRVSSKNAQIRRWSSNRPCSKAGKLRVTYVYAVPVCSRRDCVSMSWASDFYSQLCTSRRAKIPSHNFSSKQSKGLYWFRAAMSVGVSCPMCVIYQNTSMGMKVLTLMWYYPKSSPWEVWIWKPTWL